MPGYLRQSTASQSRALGPFVDDTDFKTLKTGLTIANTDIKLVANGAASANKNSGGGTHRVNGVYGVTFDATDTATVGELEVSVSVSSALVVFDKFTVLEEAVYDALFAASALGYVDGATVNVTKVNGTSQTAGDIVGLVGSPAGGTVAAALAEIEAETDDIAAVKAKTDTIPASPAAVGSAMTLTSAYDAAKTASQAGDVMKVSSGTGANQISISSGIVAADVKQVNDVALQGDGTVGTPWGPV